MAKKTSCKWNAEEAEDEEKIRQPTIDNDNCNLTNVIKNFTIHLWTNQIKIICHINLMTDPEADTDTVRKGSQKGRGKEKQGKGCQVSWGGVIIATACGCVCKWHMAMPRAVAPLETTSTRTWTWAWTSAEVATIKQSWNRPPPAAADGEKSRNEIIINSAR